MKRAAIYMRVSSEKQAQEGDSLAAQRAALMRYIDERPDLTFAGQYIDDGISGTKYSQRDELQRLLDDVRDGKIDLILFTKLDRWFRSVRHYTATQEILDRHGVGWTAIWEPIYDTTSPQGRLVTNQMMSIAQFEAENTGARIRQVQAYKLSQKEVISGSTPPGYSIVEKHLVPNQDAPNIVTAFETYSKTGNMAKTMLLTSGLSGIPKSKPPLKRMLQNTLYIGRHPAGIDDFCEPLVSESLFYDVQRKLSMNIKVSQKNVYVFSGLIRCAECRHAYGANTRRRKRGAGALKIIPQYRCSWHFNFKPAKCENPKVVTESVLESYLIDNLSEMMEGAILQFEAEATPARDRSAQIEALQKKVGRLKELFVNDLITIDEYKADREKYMDQINALEKEQSASPEEAAGAVEAMKALSGMDIKAIYGDLTKEERRRFWRGIISTIWIGKDRSIKVDFLGIPTGNK